MVNSLAFDILARDKSSRTMDKIGGKAKSMGDRFDSVGKGIAKSVGVVALGGVVALAAGLALGARSAISFEQVTLKTAAAIKSTGNVANISVGGVQAMAASLEHMSGVDEELIINAQNVLATFTKVRNEVGAGNDIFDQGTKAALNMSVALGTDLQSATIMVGKALNDPIRGITALRRAGVQLTQAQEEQIRVMVESGDVMGAQKVILAELETQFGGVAEAAGSGLAGDLARTQDAVSDLGREIGTTALPVLADMAGFVTAEVVPAVKTMFGIVGEAVEIFSDLPGPVKTAAGAMTAVVAAAPLVVSGYKKMKSGIEGVTAAFGAMGRAGKIATLSLGAIGLALAAGATILGIFASKKQRAQERVETFTAAIEADSGALEENSREAIANEIAQEGIAEAAERAGVSIETVARAIAGDADAMRSLEEHSNSLGAELDNLYSRQGTLTTAEIERADAIRAQIDATSELLPKVETQADAWEQANKEYELSKEVIGATNDALGENATATGEAGAGIEGMTGDITDQTTELDLWKQALDEANRAAMGIHDAEIRLEEAYDNATQAVADNGATLDITSEAGRNNKKSLLDVAEAALSAADGLNDGTAEGAANAAAKMDTARTAFVSTAKQMGLTETEANALADQLGLIPGNYKAEVEVANARRETQRTIDANNELKRFNNRRAVARVNVDRKAAIQSLADAKGEMQKFSNRRAVSRISVRDFASGAVRSIGRAIGSLPRSKTVSIFLKQVGTIPKFAGGTRNFEGGLAEVGERGSEIVALPKGSQIFTHAESERIKAEMRQGTSGRPGTARLLSAPAPTPVEVVARVELDVTGADADLARMIKKMFRVRMLTVPAAAVTR